MPASHLRAVAAVAVSPPARAGGRRRRWPLAAAAGVLLAVAAGGRAIDAGRYLQAAQEWTSSLGMLAPAAYILVYVAATLVGAPGLPFTLLSPVLFGVWPAFVVMVAGSALSAAIAFLIARYLARDAFAERLAGTDGFSRLSALVERHDWVVIPLLRIVPIAPFAVVNYGFGLTGISFWRYFGWSVLAMIPMNALLVLGAKLFYTGAAHRAASWPLLGAAAGAALVLIVLAARGRKAPARA